MPKLQGLALELEDCAFPTLGEVVTTADPKVAFHRADVIVFLGGFPRGPGMERKELLAKNKGIFEGQGRAIAELGLT